MSNISLPKLNIPDWARTVPEEDWKAKLFAKLNVNITTSHNQSDSVNSEQSEDSHLEETKNDSQENT